MIELTKAEEQVMQYLWKIEKGFLKDIVEQYPEPCPAYTTVSTVVRVLVKKKAIGFNTYGKVNEYYPLIQKSDYSKKYMKNLVQNFFNNSQQQFASFFTKESDLSVSELEELKMLIDQQITEKKKMMEALGLYLLKSTLASGVFYILYLFLFRKESFFALSRFYLLASLLFAYIFPFIKITINTSSNQQATIITTVQTTVNQFLFTEEPAINSIIESSKNSVIDFWWLLPMAVSLIVLFRFIQHILQLWKTIDANEKITYQKFTLVLFNQQHTFSFFRYIFISQAVWRSPNSSSIVNHELSHLKHKHSLDRLMMELMLIAFWMNPFIYLYRKALEEVHEFQADNDATKDISIKDYFKLVLQQSTSQNFSPLMSPFSYQLIKKRIKMANYKSNPIKQILVILPIVVGLLIVFASATISQTNNENSQANNQRWPSDDRVHNTIIVDLNKTSNDDALVSMNEKLSIEKSNVLPILINAQGQILIDGKIGNSVKVKSRVKQFFQSMPPTEDSSPIIFLRKDISTSTDIANQVLNDVQTAIDELRNKASEEEFNKPYSQCTIEQQLELEKKYPRQIIIAPSKNIGKQKDTKTSFSSPIKKEELNKISSGYGMRKHPFTKKMTKHNGVDYVAALNTDVLAIGDGTVRKVNNTFVEGQGYGRFVIVDHKNGYSSLYSQLSEYKIKEGQKVKEGDVIGLLGSSGLSTGPHLHLEIKKDGQFIDPEPLMK